MLCYIYNGPIRRRSTFLLALLVAWFGAAMTSLAFTPLLSLSATQPTSTAASTTLLSSALAAAAASEENEWKGDVVSNAAGGTIQGSSLQLVDGTTTEWIITIDGVQADLGRFSEAIYKKIIGDAKQQRFQGFRPGTIPPHLEPTYRAFAMDECARETVLEAMQQNDIRPFDSARSDMALDTFCIPPPVRKGRKKKKGGRKARAAAEAAAQEAGSSGEQASSPEERQWLTFETMKEAIDGGWEPGQSFSFIARNVKGQKVKNAEAGATPLGVNY